MLLATSGHIPLGPAGWSKPTNTLQRGRFPLSQPEKRKSSTTKRHDPLYRSGERHCNQMCKGFQETCGTLDEECTGRLPEWQWAARPGSRLAQQSTRCCQSLWAQDYPISRRLICEMIEDKQFARIKEGKVISATSHVNCHCRRGNPGGNGPTRADSTISKMQCWNSSSIKQNSTFGCELQFVHQNTHKVLVDFFFHEYGRRVGMVPRSSLKEGKYNQMVWRP